MDGEEEGKSECQADVGLRSELTVVRVFHLQDACVHMISLGYYYSGRLTSPPFIDAGLRKLTLIDLGNKFIYTPEIMAHRFPSSGREKWPREDERRVCFSSPKVVELTDNSWHLFFYKYLSPLTLLQIRHRGASTFFLLCASRRRASC